MTLALADFQPAPQVIRPQTTVTGPAMPFIDAHNHLGPFGGSWSEKEPAAFFDHLSGTGCVHYVDLDGGWGEDVLDDRLRRFKAYDPDRYRVFGGVDWALWPEEGSAFPEKAAARLEAQATRGAEGLKIWKPFGLTVTDDQGQRVGVDDPRLAPIWETAGRLGLPVLVHVADPVAFFDPVTPQNERWEELSNHPEWSFPLPDYPPFETIIAGFANLVSRHPNTTFIGAHVACYAENLAWVSALIDACPNLYIDFSARVAELGRVPRAARALFLRHADRILFGIDSGPDKATYAIYARFLETADEYFSYSADPVPGQGRWMIYGLNLPTDVQRRIYHDNAAQLFGLKTAAHQSGPSSHKAAKTERVL
ncbi:amidohydrolase family protein [Yoonia maricola]|uniref:Amidohydrolase family protein n=1 Tax=Yoonia maricola TaxID=420999 RepID=A0A2M8WLR2_9RHOB|nr:amidohydrolase family protein [Yoonia maricola]PJI91865.1 amidohydrolase family protein [Yoonia maricola]